MRTLKLGSKGKAVREVQTLLGDLAQVDGDFGPCTRISVRDFQRKAGLKVDGIVGPDTWAALHSPKPAEPVIDFDYMDDPPADDGPWRWIGLAIVAFAVVLFVGYLATAGP